MVYRGDCFRLATLTLARSTLFGARRVRRSESPLSEPLVVAGELEPQLSGATMPGHSSAVDYNQTEWVGPFFATSEGGENREETARDCRCDRFQRPWFGGRGQRINQAARPST
jgi:hypothetical protein